MPIRSERAAKVTLRDGSRVQLRPVQADDAAAVACLFQGLSESSRRLWFCAACPSLDGVVAWATKVDHHRRDGLVAIAGGNGRLIAHVGFERDDQHPERAELAMVIADDFQGRGLGAILLGRLARVADRVGVATLVGEVLADNHRALRMLCHSGLGVGFRQTCGVVVVQVPTSLARGAATVQAA